MFPKNQIIVIFFIIHFRNCAVRAVDFFDFDTLLKCVVKAAIVSFADGGKDHSAHRARSIMAQFNHVYSKNISFHLHPVFGIRAAAGCQDVYFLLIVFIWKKFLYANLVFKSNAFHDSLIKVDGGCMESKAFYGPPGRTEDIGKAASVKIRRCHKLGGFRAAEGLYFFVQSSFGDFRKFIGHKKAEAPVKGTASGNGCPKGEIFSFIGRVSDLL